MEDLPYSDPIQAWTRHSDQLRHLAHCLTRDESSADDLLQETWLGVQRHANKPLRNPLAWLSSVMRNAAAGAHRQEARRRRREAAVATQELQEDREARGKTTAILDHMALGLAALGDEQREVVHLRFYEGLNAPEIGARLGLSPVAVRARLHRALGKLREHLDREYGKRSSWSLLLSPTALGLTPGGQALGSVSTALALRGMVLMTLKSKHFASVLITGLLLLGARMALVSLDSRDARLHATPPELALLEATTPATESLNASTAKVQEAAPQRDSLEGNLDTSTLPRCIVTGRLVDQDGTPLIGVKVRMEAIEAWRDGFHAPEWQANGSWNAAGFQNEAQETTTLQGFRTTSDENGVFHFDVPAPTASRVALKITPDEYHEGATRMFGFMEQVGRTSFAQEARLVAGRRDLGEIPLDEACVVRGRVTNVEGRPIEDVTIGYPYRYWPAYRNLVTQSAEDGTYFLPRIPAGSVKLKAVREGFLELEGKGRKASAGKTISDYNFTLARSPTISGQTVDEFGNPLEGVSLSIVSPYWVREPHALSGDDGMFSLNLRADEPCGFAASLEGYLTWGIVKERRSLFEPGAENILIRMPSMPELKFVVLDAQSGTPVESYAFLIFMDRGTQGAGGPPWSQRLRQPSTDFEEGHAVAYAREGLDAYTISADGYQVVTGDVKHDPFTPGVQTIHLTRGAVLSGRVLRNGNAAPGVRVIAQCGTKDQHQWSRFAPTPGETYRAWTDKHGRFEVAGLKGGLTKITVQAAQYAPTTLTISNLAGNEERDVGDLQLLEFGRIEGELLLPPFMNPIGFELKLEAGDAKMTTLVDEEGRFHFEEVAPGPATIAVPPRRGELSNGPRFKTEVLPGEATHWELDARPRAMCRVELSIDTPGISLAGIRVDVIGTGDIQRRESLGSIDAMGHVAGWAQAFGEARIKLSHFGILGDLQLPEVRLNLEPGSTIKQRIKMDFASLTLHLPTEIVAPINGEIEFSLMPKGSETPALKAHHYIQKGEHVVQAPRNVPLESVPAFFQVDRNKLYFGAVPAGSYRATLKLKQDEPMPNGKSQRSKLYFKRSGAIEFTSGQAAVVWLR